MFSDFDNKEKTSPGPSALDTVKAEEKMLVNLREKKAVEKGRQDVVRKLSRQVYEMQLGELLEFAKENECEITQEHAPQESETVIQLLNHFDLLQARKEKRQSEKEKMLDEDKWRGRRWILMTINPPEGTRIEDLVDAVKHVGNHKWFTSYALVFEQRGEDDATRGQGVHCHCLFDRDVITPVNVKRDIFNALKSLWPDKKPNGRQLNYRAVLPGTEPQVLEYLLGQKKELDELSPKKEAKVSQDRMWRESIGLEPIYISNIKWLEEA